MRLQDLVESATDILYHGTTLENAANIMYSDKFVLGLTASEEHRINPPSKKYYFMSTSRIKHGNYMVNFDSDVVLVLDGKKFANNYKIKPVDVFYIDYPDDFKGKHRQPSNIEYEDRIFSDKPTIPNAIKYIKEIHILLSDYNESTYIRPAHEYAKFIIKRFKFKPVYVYDDYKNFALQDKRKSIPLSTIKYLEDYNIQNSLHSWFIRRPKGKYHNEWYDLLTLKSFAELPAPSAKMIKEMINGKNNKQFWITQFIIYLEKTNLLAIDNVDLIIRFMKKNNLKTSADVINYIYKKWEKII